MRRREKERSEEYGDVESESDLFFAVANLACAEEHLARCAMKLGDKRYSATRRLVRGVRSEAMKALLGDVKAESWCVAKHLLISTVRLMEVAAREDDDSAGKWLLMARNAEANFWLVRGLSR